MRVVVATDRIGALTSAAAGALIAQGWPTAQVEVISIGDSGEGFVDAYAESRGIEVALSTSDGYLVSSGCTGPDAVVGVAGPAGDRVGMDASSRPLGDAITSLLSRASPDRLAVDLGGFWSHDGGAGFLGALGASADRPLDRGLTGLDGVSAVSLRSARTALAGIELIGVAPAAELARPLLGLRGTTAVRGRVAGQLVPELVGVDAALESWARRAAADRIGDPGAGALGGLGLAVLALGGTLVSGPALALGRLGDRPRPDLVVTGCTTFDFASRGGGVVAEAAAFAERQLAPCVVLAAEVLIGAREMRTMGIEAAYPLHAARPDETPATLHPASLAEAALRVGRSWQW